MFPFSIGRKELAILDAVQMCGQLSGLEILAICGPAGLTHGSLYVRLGFLEEHGMLHGMEVAEKRFGNLPRRRYTITEAGKAKLQEERRRSEYDRLTDPIFDSEYQETYPIVRKVGAVLLAMVLIAAIVAGFIAMAPTSH